jgi:hypothetical protein
MKASSSLVGKRSLRHPSDRCDYAAFIAAFITAGASAQALVGIIRRSA